MLSRLQDSVPSWLSRGLLVVGCALVGYGVADLLAPAPVHAGYCGNRACGGDQCVESAGHWCFDYGEILHGPGCDATSHCP